MIMMLTVGSDSDVTEMPLKELVSSSTTNVADGTPASTATNTCRCLFGAVDPADNATALVSLRAVMDRLAAESWGYDFAAGHPIPGGRYDWTEVGYRAGNDVVRDRAVLQQVNGGEATITSCEVLTSCRPTTKRRRSAVTSCRRRRKTTRFDGVIRNAIVCTSASQQHRHAKYQRHVITGVYVDMFIRHRHRSVGFRREI